MNENEPPPGGGKMHENVRNIDSALIKKVNELDLIIISLKSEIEKLNAENLALKNTLKENKNDNIEKHQTVHFETDEDELAIETDWILNKRQSKKRKAVNSPESESKSANKLAKSNVGNNENKVGNNENKSNATIESKKIEKTHRPPPIMVTEVKNCKELNNNIRQVTKSDFTIKLLNNGVNKINVTNADDYRAVTKMLNNSNISWYSFENKQSRPIRIIIKNLHHEWSAEEITADLQKQNLKAISAINKCSMRTKEPLDMFIVSFEQSEDVKKIYEIKKVLNTVVKIEPIKHSKLIPQCKKCQGFGHTQNYCGKQPRCVKCSGKHETINCSLEKSAKPKCVNCREAHPASYRGCIVAKELQKLSKRKNTQSINEPSKVIQSSNNNTKVTKPQKTISQAVTSDKSFAQIAKTANNKQKTEKSTENDILLKILSKLDNQEVFNKELEKRLLNLENKLKPKNK